MRGEAGGEGAADTALKTKTPHDNVGNNLSLELRYENVMSHLDTINLKISDKFMMGLIFCRQNISIFKS